MPSNMQAFYEPAYFGGGSGYSDLYRNMQIRNRLALGPGVGPLVGIGEGTEPSPTHMGGFQVRDYTPLRSEEEITDAAIRAAKTQGPQALLEAGARAKSGGFADDADALRGIRAGEIYGNRTPVGPANLAGYGVGQLENYGTGALSSYGFADIYDRMRRR